MEFSMHQHHSNVSAVLSGRVFFLTLHQTLRVWLISGCAFGTSKPRLRRWGWPILPPMRRREKVCAGQMFDGEVVACNLYREEYSCSSLIFLTRKSTQAFV